MGSEMCIRDRTEETTAVEGMVQTEGEILQSRGHIVPDQVDITREEMVQENKEKILTEETTAVEGMVQTEGEGKNILT